MNNLYILTMTTCAIQKPFICDKFIDFEAIIPIEPAMIPNTAPYEPCMK